MKTICIESNDFFPMLAIVVGSAAAFGAFLLAIVQLLIKWLFKYANKNNSIEALNDYNEE
jgi:Kef-type K+ transport system membrane component KefB